MKNPRVSDVPSILSLWDTGKNSQIGLYPDDVTTGSNKVAWFYCTRGRNHSFSSRISNVVTGTGCSVCKGRQVLRGFNDFESQCSYESYFWDYCKNLDNPWEIVKSKNATRWFICELGHSFSLTINSIQSRSNWCPYCAGQRVLLGFNDLKTNSPSIASHWNYTFNKKLPEEVLSSSTKKYWFVCSEGHDFDISPYNSFIRGQWCRYCSGSAVWPGYNDISYTHPRLTRQIDISSGFDYTWVSAGSNILVPWVCDNNNSHRWLATPNDRALRGSGCPKCSNPRSKAEIDLYEWISKCIVPGIEVIPNSREILPGRKEIDIYIPSLRLGFEYNGNYWHKDKGDPEGPSARKEKLAAEKGVTLHTIWEDDWASDRSTWEEWIEAVTQEKMSGLP